MTKRTAIEESGGDQTANPDGASEPALAGSELPTVESPSISPAKLEIAADPVATETRAEPGVTIAGSNMVMTAARAEEPAANIPADISAEEAAKRPRLILRPRHKRYALLAASVALAAAFGAMVGAATTGGFSKPADVNVAGVEENKALQQSIARAEQGRRYAEGERRGREQISA